MRSPRHPTPYGAGRTHGLPHEFRQLRLEDDARTAFFIFFHCFRPSPKPADELHRNNGTTIGQSIRVPFCRYYTCVVNHKAKRRAKNEGSSDGKSTCTGNMTALSQNG